MRVGFEVTCSTAEGERAERAPGMGILPLQSDHSHRRVKGQCLEPALCQITVRRCFHTDLWSGSHY